MVMLEISLWLGKNIVRSTPENMGRCSGLGDIIEIPFKTALNTIQSIQSIGDIVGKKRKCW